MRTFDELRRHAAVNRQPSPIGEHYWFGDSPKRMIAIRFEDPSDTGAYLRLWQACRFWLKNRPQADVVAEVQQLEEVGSDFLVCRFHVSGNSLATFDSEDPDDFVEDAPDMEPMRAAIRLELGDPKTPRDRVIERVIAASFLEPKAYETVLDERRRFNDSSPTGKWLAKFPKINREDLDEWIRAEEASDVESMVEVVGGWMAINHRPKKSYIAELKSQGFSHVWILLGEQEGAPDLVKLYEAAGLEVIWLPRPNGGPITDPQELSAVRESYERVRRVLEKEGRIFLHCSAGVHRTGMVAHGLLRYLGYGPEEALETLHQLRPITAADVGNDRLDWGHQFAN